MHCPSRVRIALVILLSLFASQACLAQKAPDVRGLWAGFTELEPAASPEGTTILANHRERGTADLRITEQDGRRLQGVLIAGVVEPEDIPVQGTLADSGVITLTGKVRGNTKLVAHGKLRALPLGHMIAAFRYKLTGPGVQVRGVLITLRAIGGGTPDPSGDVSGLWLGGIRRIGGGNPDPGQIPFWMNLQQAPGSSALTGQAGIGGLPVGDSFLDVSLEVRGRVVEGSGVRFSVGLLGADLGTGIVVLFIGLNQATPARLEGRYMVFDSLIELFPVVYHGADLVADQGEFWLSQLPPPPPSDL